MVSQCLHAGQLPEIRVFRVFDGEPDVQGEANLVYLCTEAGNGVGLVDFKLIEPAKAWEPFGVILVS